ADPSPARDAHDALIACDDVLAQLLRMTSRSRHVTTAAETRSPTTRTPSPALGTAVVVARAPPFCTLSDGQAAARQAKGEEVGGAGRRVGLVVAGDDADDAAKRLVPHRRPAESRANGLAVAGVELDQIVAAPARQHALGQHLARVRLGEAPHHEWVIG